MSKVVKLKIKDVENIVSNVLKEMEFDDFDTKIQPEELPDAKYADDMNDEELLGNGYTTVPSDPSDKTVAVAQDPKTGEVYVFRVGTGEILGKK